MTGLSALLQSEKKTPFLMAHRGYRTAYPENTLAAFQGAIAAGFPMIELDVTFSKDRRLIVIHDDTLDRTTDGSGPVSDCSLEQLKALDAGSWFHPDFAGERLPELPEVFDRVGGRVFINVEIKTSAFEPECPKDAIEQQVMALIANTNALDRVLVSSFNDRILARLRQTSDTVLLALISEEPAGGDTVSYCQRIGAVSWHPDREILTRGQVERMHAAGIRVFPYNVITAGDAGRVLDMGVDGLIVDEPLAVPG